MRSIECLLLLGLIYKNVYVSVTSPSHAFAGYTCKTQDNRQGICIDLRECDDRFTLIEKQPLSEQDRAYLRKGQCGYLNQSPLVCCQPPQFDYKHLSERCGRFVSDRVFRGLYTALDAFPWTALIKYANSGNETIFKCSGAVINTNYIITSAHCVHQADLRKLNRTILAVRLGEYDLATEVDCEYNDCAYPYQDVDISEITIYEEYNSDTRDNDIALIRLARSVEFNDFIRPICLPIDENHETNWNDKNFWITGWSPDKAPFSSKKISFKVPNIAFDQCKSQFEADNIAIRARHICVGKADSILELCQGDGTNILSALDNGRDPQFILAGLFAFEPTSCVVDGRPAIYTNVVSYTNWILDHMRP